MGRMWRVSVALVLLTLFTSGGCNSNSEPGGNAAEEHKTPAPANASSEPRREPAKTLPGLPIEPGGRSPGDAPYYDL